MWQRFIKFLNVLPEYVRIVSKNANRQEIIFVRHLMFGFRQTRIRITFSLSSIPIRYCHTLPLQLAGTSSTGQAGSDHASTGQTGSSTRGGGVQVEATVEPATGVSAGSCLRKRLRQDQGQLPRAAGYHGLPHGNPSEDRGNPRRPAGQDP